MSIASNTSLRPLAAAIAVLGAILLISARGAQAQTSYRIAGRVVNAATGEPVRRATVAVLSEDSNTLVASALTDADGHFAISGLAAGKYPLTASRRGFRTSSYDEHDGFNTAIVTGPGQDTEHLVFQIPPGAVIYGSVTGDGGDPVQNAQVVLFRLDASAPERHPTRDQGATTDDTGAYEFSDLAAGQYFVAVGAQPWYAMHSRPGEAESSDNSLDVAYPVTFFDSTTDEASASPIDVTAGTRAEVDISMHAVPALHNNMTGPRQPNGGPVANLRQTVFGADFPAQVEMDGNGNSYEFVGLAPGHYELDSTNPPRTMDLNASSSMDIDPSTGTPMQPVDGTARMADGSPPGNVNLVLTRPEGGGQSNTVAQNGKFHFDAVAPGTWSLTAFSLGADFKQLYISSVKPDSGVLGTEITVHDRPVTVAVTLTQTETHIDGFARRDGRAVPGAMIVLVPLGPAARDASAYTSLVRRDQSDSDGSFSLRDVPPGRYIVVALVDGWHLDWQDHNVIARYLPGGEPVTIDTQSGALVHLPRPVEAVSP